MNPLMDDEDEQRDEILKMLGGEVDDFAGKQLPEKPEGIVLEISIKPKGEVPEEEEKLVEGKEKPEGEESDEHDPIAHILGMCGGGCTK